jgi:TusA-related sulfurtransferase
MGLVVLGVGGLWLGPAIYQHFNPTPNPIAPVAAPFVILARDKRPEKNFATLADAVAAAQTGDTIEVHADGPPITRPIKITGKALTIRAAPGAAPTVLLKRDGAKDPAVNIETDASLTLEGLAFHAIDPAPAEQEYWLVHANRCPLYVANCGFRVETRNVHALLAALESSRCEVRNCQASVQSPGGPTFVHWAYPSNGRMALENNVICGPAHGVILSAAKNAKQATLQLTHNSMNVHSPILFRVVQHSGAPNGDKDSPSFQIDIGESVFSAPLLLAFDIRLANIQNLTGTEAEARAKRLLRWREHRNVYARALERAGFLWLGKGDVAIEPTKERKDVKAWEEFWAIGNTGSQQGTIKFQGGDLIKKAKESPADGLVPAAFRLAEGSIGKRARKDGKDLGADVDLVGPGPAYERWKQTKEYQQWLKDTGQVSAPMPFFILAKGGRPEKAVATLADAVAAAQSGDIIEVNADGPPITTPINITGKALTIRAAPGVAPTLLLKRNLADDPSVSIETDAPLTLEGLTLHLIDKVTDGPEYSAVVSKQAPLRVASCRFVVEVARGYFLLKASRSPRCAIRNCQAMLKRSGASLFSSEYGSGCDLVLDNNAIAGFGVAVNLIPCGNAIEAGVRMSRNSIAANPVALILGQDPPALDGANSSVRVDARDNVLAVGGFSLGLEYSPSATYVEAKSLLKRMVRWTEQRNAYSEALNVWMGRGGKPIDPTKGPHQLAEWQAFWGIGNTGSVQGPIAFQGGDLRNKAKESPAALKPEDFRLTAESTGKGKGAGGKDLGADLDLVGPGEAYERWKKTLEYQKWLKDTGQALSADPDRRAAEWVLGIGGTILVNEQEQLIKATTALPKQGFRLTWVDLHDNKQVDDAGLASFKACKNVSGLRLDNTQVTDTGLAYFKDCKNLKMLHLNVTQVGDAGLTHFKDCIDLTGLYLSGTQVTDVGLAQFKDCMNLANLQLGHTKVTDAGLAHFKEHRNLLEVMLHSTQITDVGLAHFKDCRNLTRIYLPNTRVSDAGLESLPGCRAAQLIYLKGTQVTGAGVKKLSAALPRCKIEWEGGVIEPRPFVVLTRGNVPDRGFATLAGAVAAAQSGDTIEVNAGGPPITKLIRFRKKALTIRAAPGAAPTLLLKREAATDPEVNIMTDSSLTLEGLAFHAIGPSPPAGNWFLRSLEAPLRVAGCKFTSELQGAVHFVQAQGSQRCEIRNCHALLAQGGAALLAWDYGSNGQLVLANNAVAGFGHAVLLQPHGNVKEATFQLSRNSLAATPMALFMLRENAPPIEKATRSLRVDARENVVAVGGFSFAQDKDAPSATYAEAVALLKGLLQWTEQRNAHPEWLAIYLAKGGKPFDPTKGSLKLAEWEAFWGIANTGSMQGPIVFQGGDLRTKAKDSPAALAPEAFRLAKGSIGKGKRDDGKDLGADLDLVGPGPAYERWKKTPGYQQWLKDSGQVSAPQPFVILAKDGQPEQAAVTLQGAVAAAQSGDTIEIRGDGPFIVPLIELKKKALTLRAGKENWPVLSLAPEAVAADLPQLTTEAALTLEGLELRRDGTGKRGAGGLFHIRASGAALALTHCRFVYRSLLPPDAPHSDWTLINTFYSASPSAQVQHCEFLGDWHAGLAGANHVVNCLFLTRSHAVAFGANPQRPGTAVLHLRNNTMIASHMVNIRIEVKDAAKQPRTEPAARIVAQRNLGTNSAILFQFWSHSKEAEAFVRRDHHSFARQLVALEDAGNHLGFGPHLAALQIWPEGKNLGFIDTLDQWKEFWKLDKVRSTVGKIQFHKADLSPGILAPEKLTPQDFRLRTDDPKLKGFGADVDLVGPGPAYERWTQTEAYQQWLRDTQSNK